jgi:hypothetical protein
MRFEVGGGHVVRVPRLAGRIVPEVAEAEEAPLLDQGRFAFNPSVLAVDAFHPTARDGKPGWVLEGTPGLVTAADTALAAPETDPRLVYLAALGNDHLRPVLAPASDPSVLTSLNGFYREYKAGFLALLGCFALGIVLARHFAD